MKSCPLTPTGRWCVLLLIAAIAWIGLSGCQTLRDPNNSAMIQLTTQVAVGKFIESKSDRVGTAKKVADVAAQAKAIAASDTTTVAAVQAMVDARIMQLNLEPSDRLLATALVNVLASELRNKVGDGLLNETDRVILGNVLDTVISTANVYIPPSN